MQMKVSWIHWIAFNFQILLISVLFIWNQQQMNTSLSLEYYMYVNVVT